MHLKGLFEQHQTTIRLKFLISVRIRERYGGLGAWPSKVYGAGLQIQPSSWSERSHPETPGSNPGAPTLTHNH